MFAGADGGAAATTCHDRRMARFEPFRGLRYDDERLDYGLVTAPPYDVISDDERADFAGRHRHHAVHLDLPVDDGEVNRYDVACRTLREWRDDGVLVQDDEPTFYVYRMGYKDDTGRLRQTAGVIGALELAKPGTGGVLPHEQTTPKAKSDRLEMLRSCRANLSAVWGLSTADGLSALCELPGPPVAAWTDGEGVHHRLWTITQPGIVDAIASAVSSEPVVIADGHHRWSTSLQYRDERHAAGDGAGPWDLAMTYVVELVEEQLLVQPIHRLIRGLPDGFDLLGALEASFEAFDAGPVGPELLDRMDDAGALCLVTSEGAWLLRPRPEAMDGVRDLDSSRLDKGLASVPEFELTYQHGVDNILAAVSSGAAQAGVLLRPATVEQIIDIAHGGELMPPKTTFFWPKPRTGQVFRLLDD
jgi:uncharacterized protein (DUF1015 family)